MSVRANVRVCARAPASVNLRSYNVFLIIYKAESLFVSLFVPYTNSHF